MRLVENSRNWQIEGQGRERARVAYASKKGANLSSRWPLRQAKKLAR